MSDSAGPGDALSGWLDGASHFYPLRVYFEDTDAGGLVYHSQYLNFCERARTEMMALIGCDHKTYMVERGQAFVIRAATLDYRRPAGLGDTLTVETRPYALGRTSMRARQIVRRGEHVLTDIDIAAVCVQLSTGRPARIPQDVRSCLEGYSWSDPYAGERAGDSASGS